MTEIANLNKIRKLRQRSAERKSAAENRVRFGQSKNSVTLNRQQQEKQGKNLDGKRLKDDANDS